jgi:hypothetical protein
MKVLTSALLVLAVAVGLAVAVCCEGKLPCGRSSCDCGCEKGEATCRCASEGCGPHCGCGCSEGLPCDCK